MEISVGRKEREELLLYEYREKGREGREGREGGSHFCQRTESQRRGRGARLLCSLS